MLKKTGENFSKDLGKKGERFVAEYLKAKKNYKIISLNTVCGVYGEIDIIAKDGNDLVFVEVKTRESDKFMDIFESINYRKKQALIHAVNFYISKNNLENYRYRIDLATLNLNTETIEYFEDLLN